MPSVSSIPAGLFKEPSYYLVEFQDGGGRFSRMTRATYFHSIFTDRARIRPASSESVVFCIKDLVAKLHELDKRPGRINFIFHTAHCGSTLLSRALDLPGRTISYREPSSLRQLGIEAARINGREANQVDWHNKLELALVLLSRRYTDAEIPVVKANVPVNFILTEVLGLLPEFRALLLYSKLESFLVSVLKHPRRRQWATNVSQNVTGGIRTIKSLSEFTSSTLSVPKIAATLWVAQMAIFHDVLATFKDVRALESDQFFVQTENTLLQVAKLFGIDVTTDEISAISNSELFSRYSKNPAMEYNAQTRASVHARVLAEFRSEIDEGMQWGVRLCDQCGIHNKLAKALF